MGAAQDSRRLPILSVDDFGRGLKPLADTLLHQAGSQPNPQPPGGRLFKLGPIKVRV